MLSPELRFWGLLKLGKQKPRQTQSYGLGGTCAGSWARCLLAVWAVSSSCHLILFPQEKTKDFEMFSEMSPHLRSATCPKHSMVWHLLSCHPTSGPSDRILRQLESPACVSLGVSSRARPWPLAARVASRLRPAALRPRPACHAPEGLFRVTSGPGEPGHRPGGEPVQSRHSG